MPNLNEISSYNRVGLSSWIAYKEWMSQPDCSGKPLPEDEVLIIRQEAFDLGLSEEDVQQAISEGSVAARIQLDLDFASTQSVSDLKKRSRNICSPLACVARELSLVGMIQRGELNAFVTKREGEDILPELRESLSGVRINP